MKSFFQFISENTNSYDAFEKAKFISTYLDGRNKETFISVMDFFKTSIQNKSVFNARFKEAYSYDYSRNLENAYKKLWDTHRNEVKDIVAKEDEWDLWGLQPASIAKVYRIYSKYPSVPKEIKEFMEAIKNLPAAIKELKTYIQAGREKKEPLPGAFVKPMASVEASKKAVQFLTEAVDSFKKEYEISVNKTFDAAYKSIKDKTIPSDLKNVSSINQFVASMIFITRGYGKNMTLELKTNSEEIVKRIAENTVKDVIEKFVYKNTSKLALIFQKKAEITEHKILSTKIQGDTLENRMFFKFSDESSFEIYSQIVYKYSNQGKDFVQLPTRFTNVKMADGTTMKMPSEEKMITIF